MDGGVDVNSFNGQYNSFEANYGVQPAYSNTNTYGQLAVKFENDAYHSEEPTNVAPTYPYGGNGFYQTTLQQALNQEFGTNHVTPVQKVEPATYGMSFQTGRELDTESDTGQNKKTVTTGITCDICNKQFSSQPSLKRHKETHLGHKRFSCELCGNCYTQKHNLTKHMRLHTGEKPYKCTICEKAFYIHHHLKNHMVQHTGEYPYTCQTCGRGFKHKNKMEAHAATHEKNAVEGIPVQSPPSVGIHSEENSMSEIWDNVSENMVDESEDYTEDMLDDSFDEEIRNEEHECEICQQIFINAESLNNHVKLTHSVIEEFKCDECGNIFLSQAHLVQHRKVHASKGTYKCEDCGASFRFKVSLHIHMRRHNNDYKKHECSLCNKYFLSKESLKKHMSDHLKMTVYQCDECGEEFDQKAEFTSHVLTHSENDSSPKVKPFCKICHKSFSSNSSLRKHEFIHLDVKPHKCEICNVSFAQKIQLRLHNKRHNGGILEPLTPPPPPAPVQELAPAPAPSPQKATKLTKKEPKDSPTKSTKTELVPERRNAPRKARNALREQREEENGDKQSAKSTGRRNAPRKARNVIKEEEEEEEEEEEDSEESSDSDDSSSDDDDDDGSDDDGSGDDDDDDGGVGDKQPEKNQDEQYGLDVKSADKKEGYRYPVCEKCNQTFRKRSVLKRHQKSCR